MIWVPTCCSVAKSCLTLWPHGLQHIRLPCPSLFPRVCSNSCPLSPWCHPTISSSVTPFSSCPLSFPASESFPMSRLFTSGGQTIGASASASVLPVNIQGWFPLGLTGLISLLSMGLSRVFFSTTVWNHQFFFMVPTCPVLKKAVGFTREMCCSWPISVCYPEIDEKNPCYLHVYSMYMC